MRVTQIVYKVDDLTTAVNKAKKKGYVVEYGRTKNPYNAFIYFDEGPFIEIMENTGVPGFINFFFKLFGLRGYMNRFEKWDSAPEGPLGIGIEVEDEKLELIKKELEAEGIAAYKIPIKRVGIDGKDNICYALFPENTDMPFYVTSYKNPAGCHNTEHPNKIKGIDRVDLCLKDKEYEIVENIMRSNDLLDDLGGELLKREGVFLLKMKNGE